MFSKTILRTTVSGTARNAPGRPHSRPQTDSAARITSGLMPTARPKINGSTVAPDRAWTANSSPATASGAGPKPSCSTANPAGSPNATTLPRYGMKLHRNVRIAHSSANRTPNAESTSHTGAATAALEITFARM